MSIGDSGRIQGIGSAYDAQSLRATRQVDLTNRVQEATLTPEQALTPQEAAQHNGLLNGMVGDCDRLKSGDIGGIPNVTWGGLSQIFGDRQDCNRVHEATKPNWNDNGQAAEVRTEYRKAFAEAQRERTRASREAQKLGPGHHALSNGDQVDVATDPRTGRTTVKTTSQDGTVKTVSFEQKDPSSVEVTKQHPDGTTDSLSRHGTDVSRTHSDGEFGQTTRTDYHIDEQGRPVRERRGPNGDDYDRTTANPDGSSDDRQEIYVDDNGQPVYEDKHQDPRWEPIPLPPWHDPWRPFPHPRYPWEPEPFQPRPLRDTEP